MATHSSDYFLRFIMSGQVVPGSVIEGVATFGRVDVAGSAEFIQEDVALGQHQRIVVVDLRFVVLVVDECQQRLVLLG